MPAANKLPSVGEKIETSSDTAIAVIVNPASLPSGVDQFEAHVRDILGDRRVDFFRTGEHAGAGPIAAKAIESGAGLLIAAGGDGTVMQTIGATVGTAVPVGIIPLGTGNLLAVNLNLPLELDAALDIALHGKPTTIDLLRQEGSDRFFAIMGGLGYDAQIMHETPREEKRRFGRLAYLRAALRNVRGKRFGAVVTVDDQPPIRVLAKCILVANLGSMTPGLKLFNEAAPDDGIIEVGILKANRIGHFLHLLIRAIIGRIDEAPWFDTYRAHRVRIECGRPQPLELDGEPQDPLARMEVVVAPNAATIMMA